jgi:uncharacterized membrane protein (TIGR02234 family)
VTSEADAAVQPAPRPPRRYKSRIILATTVLGILALISWTQTWFAVELSDGVALAVDGQVGAPALSALALTSLVLVGALSIAGPFFRIVFGVLQTLIGVAILFSAVIAVTGPVAAASPAISEATGVAGAPSVAALVDSIALTPWPWVALAAGALIVLLGVAIVVTGRRWPGSTSKYQTTTRLEPAPAQRTSVDDWDSLSGGDDPTTRD